MNNKGFAITTILYGTLILFLMLLLSMLGILNAYKGNLEKLLDTANGARDIVTIEAKKLEVGQPFTVVDKRGLYCNDTECKYVAVNK